MEIHASSLASASAHRDFAGRYIVRVETALLEQPKMTDDVLTLILCHELGHLFGGSPLRPVPEGWDGPVGPNGESLFSAEGQADYYASRVCFRKLAGPSARKVPAPSPRVKAICEKEWGMDVVGIELCERTAVAALAFLTLNFEFPISFETPDQTVADRTLVAEYPLRQCRLDTFVSAAGVRAERGLDLRILPAEPRESRLPCWFKD